jgi:hypothetical protein
MAVLLVINTLQSSWWSLPKFSCPRERLQHSFDPDFDICDKINLLNKELPHLIAFPVIFIVYLSIALILLFLSTLTHNDELITGWVSYLALFPMAYMVYAGLAYNSSKSRLMRLLYDWNQKSEKISWTLAMRFHFFVNSYISQVSLYEKSTGSLTNDESKQAIVDIEAADFFIHPVKEIRKE